MPDQGKSLFEVLHDTATRKLRAAQIRFSGSTASAEPPREVFLSGCQQIGEAFAADGFSYAKSGPKLTRKAAGFTFQISFQSSHNNISGELVALWIHANVHSKELGKWRNAQKPVIRSNDYVAGGQIGNLLPKPAWMEWDLAHPEKRAETLSDAIATIRRVVLPYFESFEDPSITCVRLLSEEIPSMTMPTPIEYLLCFADKQKAETCLHHFLHSHPEILLQYRHELKILERDGFPRVQDTGYAKQLAYAAFVYGLAPL